METLWNPAARGRICRRVERLTPDAKARWGKLSAAQMMAHVNDATRMAIGELAVRRKGGPLRYFPLKQLILYVLPFPKGAPTAPELLVRCVDADLAAEQAEFVTLLDRAAARTDADPWPEHPAFGRMTREAWGTLGYKHTDHHLRQFGV